MDKKHVEAKKYDPKSRDRGDVRRVVKIPRKKTDIETQMSTEYLDDRGDSFKVEEVSEPAIVPLNLKTRAADSKNFDYERDRDRLNKRYMRPEKEEKSLIDRRRELAQRYTFRLVADGGQRETRRLIDDGPAKKLDAFKLVSTKPLETNEKPQYLFEVPQVQEVPQKTTTEQSNQTQSRPTASQKKSTRKPVIKTITNRGNSVKIYKAVSFVENKAKTTPLTLHISRNTPAPRSVPRQKTSSASDYSQSIKSESNKLAKPPRDPSPKRTSPVNKKLTLRTKKPKPRNRRKNPSPELKPPPQPKTEVAKWAPQCINEHTKPYYEAWVNTSLAAITKDDDPDLNMEKEEIMRRMKRAMEYNPHELTEDDLSDERYTGRIRVRR